MPNKNRTGPEGKGPKTGRQMGNCEGAEPVAGNGFGMGSGRGMRACGRGCGCRFTPVTLSKEQKTKVLEAELAEIEAEKTEIQKQLKELKA